MKAIGIVFVFFLHGLVHASECTPLSPNEIAQSAKIAFIGTVTAVAPSDYKPWPGCWEHSSQGPDCGGRLVTLEVTDQLRGNISTTATVLAEDACYCLGPYWKVGAAYLVVGRPVAEHAEQIVAANQCEGTMDFTEDASPLVKALRESKKEKSLRP